MTFFNSKIWVIILSLIASSFTFSQNCSKKTYYCSGKSDRRECLECCAVRTLSVKLCKKEKELTFSVYNEIEGCEGEIVSSSENDPSCCASSCPKIEGDKID